MSEFPCRLFPCDECPIRADNADNPKSKFPAERWDALSVTVRTRHHSPEFGDIMFGCHKGAPGSNEDLACAGWLAQFGSDHPAVRLALITGRLPISAVRPGANWPPLHKTWDDVVSAQTPAAMDVADATWLCSQCKEPWPSVCNGSCGKGTTAERARVQHAGGSR